MERQRGLRPWRDRGDYAHGETEGTMPTKTEGDYAHRDGGDYAHKESKTTNGGSTPTAKKRDIRWGEYAHMIPQRIDREYDADGGGWHGHGLDDGCC